MRQKKLTIQFINGKKNNYIAGDNINQAEMRLNYKDLFICDFFNE